MTTNESVEKLHADWMDADATLCDIRHSLLSAPHYQSAKRRAEQAWIRYRNAAFSVKPLGEGDKDALELLGGESERQ